MWRCDNDCYNSIIATAELTPFLKIYHMQRVISLHCTPEEQATLPARRRTNLLMVGG